MKTAVIGGDERFRHAAEELRRLGHEVLYTAKWPGGWVDLAIVPAAEAIVGEEYGLAVVQRGRGNARRAVFLEDDEDYLQANACLTAEGALHAAMGEGGKALYGAKCLITGYGRIARAMYGMLRSMKADASVAVRPGKSMRRAQEDGAQYISMEEAREKIAEFDYIWNTVPERIFGEADVRRICKGAGLFDLASAPFGFAIEDAWEACIWTERLGGLPGKYSPKTAGQTLAHAALRAYRERMERRC